jgi:hypothetical protein
VEKIIDGKSLTTYGYRTNIGAPRVAILSSSGEVKTRRAVVTE